MDLPGKIIFLLRSMATLRKILFQFMAMSVFALPQLASAQDSYDAELDGSTFKEGYANTLDVSAGIIVGLSLGQNTGISSLNETFIAPSKTTHDAMCLRINSVDGLFWSENEFNLRLDARQENRNGNNLPSVRFSPLTNSFMPQLRSYGPKKVIGFGKVSKSDKTDKGKGSVHCESNDYALFPIQSAKAVNKNILQIYVNSSNRYTTLVLSLDGSEVRHDVECKPSDFDIAAIFDQSCTIEIPPEFFGQFINASLSFSSPPFGTEVWRETVFIPALNP